MGKLHFITLNYVSDYTFHLKLFKCTLCTLTYHTYHTLHPNVIFAIIFNRILLHMTSTCILLRWNKFKRLKHHISRSIKTKANFFQISPPGSCACQPLPETQILVNPKSSITNRPADKRLSKASNLSLSMPTAL